MSEEKTVSKPRQLWDSAVKAVKGGGTEQLIETFTAEMIMSRRCWTPPCEKIRRR